MQTLNRTGHGVWDRIPREQNMPLHDHRSTLEKVFVAALWAAIAIFCFGVWSALWLLAGYVGTKI